VEQASLWTTQRVTLAARATLPQVLYRCLVAEVAALATRLEEVVGAPYSLLGVQAPQAVGQVADRRGEHQSRIAPETR
jgi:hypothetical protein